MGRIVTLSTPSTSDIGSARVLFDAHRRKLGSVTGVPAALLGRDRWPLHVFPGDAMPSIQASARHLAAADVAAMDAVEGRAVFVRVQQAR